MAKDWRELNALDLSYAWNGLLGRTGDNLRTAHHLKKLLEDGWTPVQVLAGMLSFADSSATHHILAFTDEPETWITDDPLICEGYVLERIGSSRLPDSYADYCNLSREQGVPDPRIARAFDAAHDDLQGWLDAEFERVAANSRNFIARFLPKRGRQAGRSAVSRSGAG